MTLTSKPQADLFDATRWSLVLAAGGTQAGSGAHRALGELCQAYWYPLYAYARRHGHGVPQAEDAVQGFFAHLLEERKLFHSADPERGRFRAFLLGSFKNWLASDWARSQAEKRGGGVAVIELDALTAEERYRLEPADPAVAPERDYDRRWALALLSQTLDALAAEYAAAGKSELFEALRPLLTAGDGALPQAEIARRLGISEVNVKVSLHRLRQRWRERLRQEVAQTVASDTDVKDECRYLLECL